MLNERLSIVPLYYSPTVVVHASERRGLGADAPNSAITWNIYEWERRGG
jgi:hypothetical protein